MQGNLFNKIKDIFVKRDEGTSAESSPNDQEQEIDRADHDITSAGESLIDTPENGMDGKAETTNQLLDQKEETADGTAESTVTDSKHSPEEIKKEVVKVLKTCYDPEIPVDVYELGLIYEIKVATNGDVLIIMTLTSPACPVAGILPNEIEQKVREHPMVNDCKVELTFDPPWNQRMMSEVAMLELGFM